MKELTYEPQQVCVKASVLENGKEAMMIGMTHDAQFVAVTQTSTSDIYFAGKSKGTGALDRMLGSNDVVELLVRAVNNRTRQRNYFRLYSQMVDGEITEEEFDKAIEDNEDDYVIEETEKPSCERLQQAMHLCSGIKDVNDSEDLANLFSFDSAETDRLLVEMDKQYECVQ